MPLEVFGSVTDLIPAHDIFFRLELLGATVSCRVTRPAIDRWQRKQNLFDQDIARGIRRVARDVVEPLLRQARTRRGERWDAWFGADSVALMIGED